MRKYHLPRSVLLLLLISGLTSSVRSQSLLPTEQRVGFYQFEQYTQANYGLAAHAQNWSVTQDGRGIIYIGNSAGVLEFDGTSWRRIPVREGAVVHTIVQGHDGAIYVGANNELGYLSHDTTATPRYISLLGHIQEQYHHFGEVWSAAARPEGTYLLTNKVLFRWDGNQMSYWPAEGGNFFRKLFVVHDTLYVFQSGVGLLKLVEEELSLIPGGERLAKERLTVLLPHQGEQLLAGLATKGLFILHQGTRTRFGSEADTYFAQHWLFDGLHLPDGRYAFATLRGGAVLMDPVGHVLQVLDRRMGLTSQAVKQLFSDVHGGLWMALDSGVARVHVSSPLTLYDGRASLDEVVVSLAQHEDTLYAGTRKGIYRLPLHHKATEIDSTPSFSQISNVEEEEVFTLLSTPYGLLVGMRGGLCVVQHGRVTKLTNTGTVYTLSASQQDPHTFYAGTQYGLEVLHYERERWTLEEGFDPMHGQPITSIYADDQGALWLGSPEDGLWWIEPTTLFHVGTVVQHFNPEEGYPKHIFSLTNLNGGLRIVSDQGLLKPTISQHGAVSLEPDSSVQAYLPAPAMLQHVQQDKQGHLWIWTDSYLTWSEWKEDSIEARSQPSIPLPNRMASSQQVVLDDKGTLYSAGARGVIRIDAQAAIPSPAPFEIYIRRVQDTNTNTVIFGGGIAGPSLPGIASPKRITLKKPPNGLRFMYTAPTYEAKADIRYQYYLEGFNTEWSEWTRETQKDYTNLPPGSYRFRVRARNAQGLESEEASYAFILPQPWYQTWWAYLGYSVLGLLLIAGGLLATTWRLSARLRQDNLQLKQTVATQTAEIQRRTVLLETQNKQLEWFEKQNISSATRLFEGDGSNKATRELVMYEPDPTSSLNTRPDQPLTSMVKDVEEAPLQIMRMASHGLRVPLTSIIGFAEVLEYDFDLEEEPRQLIERIGTSAQQIEDFLTDLLNTVAIEYNQILIDKKPIDLTTLAEQVVRKIQGHAVRKTQAIHFLAPDNSPCWVEADSERLQEAMNNLISNAIKYSPPEKPIYVMVYERGKACYFVVRDEGPGLSEDDKEKLFKPFQRLTPKPTAGEPSTGLGLYVVKHFVELQGGHVQVKTKEGIGSAFILSLPAVDQDYLHPATKETPVLT